MFINGVNIGPAGSFGMCYQEGTVAEWLKAWVWTQTELFEPLLCHLLALDFGQVI